LSLTDKGLKDIYAIELPTGHTKEINPFLASVEAAIEPIRRTTKIIRLNTFSPQIIRKAIDKDPFFAFSNLKRQFGKLASVSEFSASDKYLGGVSVELTADVEDLANLTVSQRLYIIQQVLSQIKNYVSEEDIRYAGTEAFEPRAIKETFKERYKLKIATSDSPDKEYGRSTYQSNKYMVDLRNTDWFIYSDHYGTSEEKSLVKTIEALIQELEKEWSDIYLARNEGFIKIYAFDDGAAFEPDFILFANDRNKGSLSWQVFIEPKGNQFLGDSGTFDDGKEAWKQRFLHQIKERFKTATLLEDENYRVVGLPFYNEQHTKDAFVKELTFLNKD